MRKLQSVANSFPPHLDLSPVATNFRNAPNLNRPGRLVLCPTFEYRFTLRWELPTVTIGTYYSPVLALLQAITPPTSGATVAPPGAPAESAPPATPLEAVLLGPAALGTEFRLGQSVDAQA
jgi:hypothetical protein